MFDFFLTRSHLWNSFDIVHLTDNLRLSLLGDKEAGAYADFLLSVGEGRVQDSDGNIQLPKDMLLPENSSPADLIRFV